MENNARQLITGLLEMNVSQRLGCLKDGSEDIKKSAWFGIVDWKVVEKKMFSPPWVPEILHNQDS